MLTITLNGKIFICATNFSLLHLFKKIGLNEKISRFCFDENLPIAGNCRACLVEIEHIEKPVASCVAEVEPNIRVWQNSQAARKARENVFEMLLLNHPLDCPICDQAGECDLQDQTKTFGGTASRFFYKKRSVVDKNSGFFIKTIMTRCIHCTRCVRFNALIGSELLGVLNRGTNSEIGLYNSTYKVESELMGNVIDLCPVGALTSRVFSFQTRPWEIKINEGLDLTDGLGSNIYLHFKDLELIKITPKSNSDLNGIWLTDKCRFSMDSVKINRLKKLYEFNNNNYKSITWFAFLNKWILNNKQTVLNTSDRINILINEDSDMFTLMFLKKLSNKYCNKIKISILRKKNIHNNLYVFNTTASLANIEHSNNCFLLSSNPKLECTLLHFKLKLKYQQKIFSIFCIGRFFYSTFTINFWSLNIKNIFGLWEAKLPKISKFLQTKTATLFIIGESFYKRILNFNLLVFFFLKTVPTAKIVKLNTLCNEESLWLFNTVGGFKKREQEKYFCINLAETLFLKRYLFKRALTIPIWWFNEFRPFFFFNARFLIPLTSSIETQSLYLNFEQRVQKMNKIYNNNYESRSLIKILSALFNDEIQILKSTFKYFSSLEEISINQHLFSSLKNKLTLSLKTFNYSKYIYSLYPLKSHLSLTTATTTWLHNSSNFKTKLQSNKLNYNNFE